MRRNVRVVDETFGTPLACRRDRLLDTCHLNEAKSMLQAQLQSVREWQWFGLFTRRARREKRLPHYLCDRLYADTASQAVFGP